MNIADSSTVVSAFVKGHDSYKVSILSVSVENSRSLN